jgi:predicted dehydrogenase
MRVGVIGTGAMGENHVRVYSSIPDHCQLIGVYDSNETRAKEVAARYQIKNFNKVEDLLQCVDAVSIAVPTEFHYEIGLACIAHKVHMLMEKPIASSSDQARDLIEKAKETGIKLQVGHIELFNPTVRVLRNILANEEIIAVDVHRMSPFNMRNLNVDVVQDLMIHDLYILYELLNDKIDHFFALGRQFENTTKHAIVVSKFKSGIIAQLTASFKTEEKVRTIRIITNKAFIQANLLDRKIVISRSTNFFVSSGSTAYSQQNIIEKVSVPEQEPLKMQLIDFIDCIKTNREPTVTGEDGAIALSISNKISGFIKDNYID